MLSKRQEASKFQGKPSLVPPIWTWTGPPVPTLFHLRCGIKSSWSITWLLLQAMLPASWPMSLAWQMRWILGSRRPSGGRLVLLEFCALNWQQKFLKMYSWNFLPILLGFGETFQGLCLLVLGGVAKPRGAWDPKITLEVCCQTRQWNNPNSRRAPVICPPFFCMHRREILVVGFETERVAKKKLAPGNFHVFLWSSKRWEFPPGKRMVGETVGADVTGGFLDVFCLSDQTIGYFVPGICFLAPKRLWQINHWFPLRLVMKPFRKTEEGPTLGGVDWLISHNL